ncbi:MAG TPA: CoB--CoM heterodisulfide reductase iron-sulfur subunit B family protein [Patescibacteria group bacterium]|nr:CoB--CoM heterodisulfide reductase iron-sulfur subunit B family protein [Patescibacteria group bacterium]
MEKYLLYPGCAMERSASAYLDSTMAIRDDIAIEFEEVKDWNCCGATEYISVAQTPAHALIGRNLALASQQINGTNTLVAGCSACYLNLSKTDNYMLEDDKLSEQVNVALSAGGLNYQPGTLKIRHLLDIILNDVGLAAIREKVIRPLKQLRIAPYYGCMITRPDPNKHFRNAEYPQSLDKVMRALGAEVIDYPMKTHCCGGHMTQISESTAYEMIRGLLYGATQYKADVMVTLCPMCQLNLDAYQENVNKHFKTNFNIPILYFTQLMGLAFGHDAEELGIGKEFVSPGKALAKIGIEIPEDQASPKTKRKKDDPSLPMPAMPKDEEVI